MHEFFSGVIQSVLPVLPFIIPLVLLVEAISALSRSQSRE